MLIRPYIRLLRPEVWLVSVAGLMVGVIIASQDNFSLLPVNISALITAILGMASATILNDICDRQEDKTQIEFKPLASGQVDIRDAKILYILIVGLFLANAYMVNGLFFVLTLVAWLVSLSYSVKPLRFKERHILSYVSMAFGACVLLPFMGYVAKKQTLDIMVIAPVNLVLFTFALFAMIGKDIVHHHIDCAAGTKTFVVRVGKKRAINMQTTGMILSPLLLPLFVITGLLPTNCMIAFVFYPAIVYMAAHFRRQRFEEMPASPYMLMRNFTGFSIFAIVLALGFVI